jgi:hypothetical protein
MLLSFPLPSKDRPSTFPGVRAVGCVASSASHKIEDDLSSFQPLRGLLKPFPFSLLSLGIWHRNFTEPSLTAVGIQRRTLGVFSYTNSAARLFEELVERASLCVRTNSRRGGYSMGKLNANALLRSAARRREECKCVDTLTGIWA